MPREATIRTLRVGLCLALLVVVVVACGATASRGTMPPPDANGMVNPSSAPDFIAYSGRTDGMIGWIPKTYLLDLSQHCGPGPGCDPIPVYGDDLRTLIGHDVAGRGFVPLGVDPATIPEHPGVAGPSIGTPSP